MVQIAICCIYLIIFCTQCVTQTIHETDVNFRVEAGARTCFFEKGRAGQMMEAYYQVLDGQHGDLDIVFQILDPNGVKLVNDHKKSQNSIIMDLEVDGDYVFCLDNTYSVMNSKLVFVYVMIEDKVKEVDEAEVAVEEEDGGEHVEVLEWEGIDVQGEKYYVEVRDIAESLKRTLKHVVKARHLLDLYGAGKSRDHYLAYEDTFIVDVWSSFQISFMFVVGLLQVYMIKKMFNRPDDVMSNLY